MKDTDYIGKICKDFNILSSYAHTKKYQSRKTYKELYEELKEDEILIKKAQEILVKNCLHTDVDQVMNSRHLFMGAVAAIAEIMPISEVRLGKY